MSATFYVLRRAIRKQRILRDRRDPLDLYDSEEMYKRYRFFLPQVLWLVDLVKNDLLFEHPREGCLPPHIQVFLTLRFLATGVFYGVLADDFGISFSCAFQTVARVIDALMNKAKFSLPAVGRDIALNKEKFFRMSGFPGVIGCVDGTHVKILGPKEDEADFVNRHHVHSLNIQVVCDADLKVVNLVAKWPGSTHDARMLRNSDLFTMFETPQLKPYAGNFLGDSAYMLRDWLMTPLDHPITIEQRRYNSSHKSTRSTVERCIGVAKRRWHCLHTELRMDPVKACKLIFVCFWLHNIAVNFRMPDLDGEEFDVDQPPTDPFIQDDNPNEKRRHDKGVIVRNALINNNFRY